MNVEPTHSDRGRELAFCNEAAVLCSGRQQTQARGGEEEAEEAGSPRAPRLPCVVVSSRNVVVSLRGWGALLGLSVNKPWNGAAGSRRQQGA